jgi:hypothetical protein
VKVSMNFRLRTLWIASMDVNTPSGTSGKFRPGPGESHEEAIIRELAEEAGLTVVPVRPTVAGAHKSDV